MLNDAETAIDADLTEDAQQTSQRKHSTGNTCPICEKRFERLYNLKVHLRKHTGETPYDCPVQDCPRQFKWRSSMAHHVRAHHDVSETVSTQVRARLGGYEHKRSRQTSNKTVAEMNTTPTPLVKPRMKKVARKSGPKAPKKGSRNACVAVTKKEEQCVMLGGTETNLEADSIASRNGVRGEDANVELLEMLSDLLSNDEPSFYEGSEPSPSMPMETSEDPLENGLVFLAPGADDVTDAEMASLAQMHVQGAGLAMSGSMESQVTSLGSFLLP